MPFYLEIRPDKTHPNPQIVGPFDSYMQARDATRPFIEEGLHVTMNRTDHVCDFCSAVAVTQRLTAEDISVPEIGWASTGDWAACDECFEIIFSEGPHDEKVEQLGKRSMEAAVSMFRIPDDPMAVKFFGDGVRMIHRAFFTAWTGEARRHE